MAHALDRCQLVHPSSAARHEDLFGDHNALRCHGRRVKARCPPDPENKPRCSQAVPHQDGRLCWLARGSTKPTKNARCPTALRKQAAAVGVGRQAEKALAEKARLRALLSVRVCLPHHSDDAQPRGSRGPRAVLTIDLVATTPPSFVSSDNDRKRKVLKTLAILMGSHLQMGVDHFSQDFRHQKKRPDERSMSG